MTETDLHHTATELRIVLGQLSRRLREQASTGDFTHSQSGVLLRLEREGPATMSALARAEGIRPQSMAAIVASLEAGGYIAGEPDPTDGRKTVLSLTDLTREQVSAGRLAKEDWLFSAIDAQLDPAEQQTLTDAVALLQRLARA